ncbi:MAG: hypothetical protein JXR18_01340 [Neptuniibacter sp.]
MPIFGKRPKSSVTVPCEVSDGKIHLCYSDQKVSIAIDEIAHVEFEYDFALGLMASVIFVFTNNEIISFNGHVLFETGVIESIQKVLPGFLGENELKKILDEAPMYGTEFLWSKNRVQT